MIITCPDCTTRYDVDDERFSPNGRSVRCSSCGESWFVPAPELIDVAPMDERDSRRRQSGEDEGRGGPDLSARPRMKVGIAEDDRGDGRRDEKNSRRNAAGSSYDDREFVSRGRDAREEDRDLKSSNKYHRAQRDVSQEDDSLFDSSDGGKKRGRDSEDHRGDRSDKHFTTRDDKDHSQADKAWRKGRQFIVEDDDESDDAAERRPFFARKRKDTADVRGDRDGREALRFADDEDDGVGADANRYDDDERYNNAHVVDADWEDVDEGDSETTRGFGRKVRADRRRATALARMEDVRPLDPEALDEEFFAALKVTPRELERAIRKARRRAEAREKNRLTPLRVFGWTAWTAVVAGAAYGIFVFRDEIVKMAPKAADAYAVIGIDANPYGLSIENVRHRLAMSTGGPTIEITGNLRNETDGAVVAPLLQAEALGPRGELLARWTFTANQSDVAQGEMVDFITRAPAPEGVAEVALSFAPEKSVINSLKPAQASPATP